MNEMGRGLNVGNHYVVYDRRLTPLINHFEFFGQLVFNMAFPFLLSKLNGHYYMTIGGDNIRVPGIEQRDRKIVFAGTRHWENNVTTLVPRQSSLGGGIVLSTLLTVALELSQDEIEFLRPLINDTSKLEEILKEIIQPTMESILHKYNEAANGVSYKTPSYSDMDRIDALLLTNRIQDKIVVWHYVAPNDFPILDETPIEQITMAQTVVTWKYFHSKALYHFSCKEYLDGIISAAISIEAFAYSKVDGLPLSSAQKEKYVERVVVNHSDAPKYLSVYQLVKKLKRDGYLGVSLSNTKIEKLINNIQGVRNDIMHGKLQLSSSLMERAADTHCSLVEFYANLDVHKEVSGANNASYIEAPQYGCEQQLIKRQNLNLLGMNGIKGTYVNKTARILRE